MSAVQLAPYQVEAYNTAKASENKIHDDAVAQKFGFTGGLVPGVDVYAYMTHQPVEHWGRAWLERGTIECRFGKPVYDGEVAVVTAAETESGLTLEVESLGEHCAAATASLPSRAVAAPSSGSLQADAPPREDVRPPASETSMPERQVFASRPIALTPELAAQYLHDVRETDPLYVQEQLAHPGFLLRLCNRVLSDNVVLGPWMHVGSIVHNQGLARIGETVSARARVARNYEHKGHRFVELDVLVLADERPVVHVVHTAIWLPRQLAAA